MRKWDVNVSEQYEEWWETLNEAQQISVSASVKLLAELGPILGFPHSSGVEQSKHSHMRELLIQHRGKPYRVLYAFDPSRAAILLLGGDKTGNARWYEENVPKADKIYDVHLNRYFGKKRR